MARRFNGSSDYIVFTVSTALQSVTAGSTTIVVVASFADGTDGAMVHARTSGGTNSWWMETFSNVWNYGQGTTPKNVGGQTNGSWAAYIGRKTTGGANAPRGRKIIFGGATTDTTAGSGLADGTAPGSGGILQVGKWGAASEFISADVAAVAVFNSDLSDGTTATFTTWQAILDASPVWAVHFNQANAGDSITDATGNGGNSSSITGTTIVSNPAGFFGATVTGTAAAPLGGLTGSAAGTRIVLGTAAASLGALAGTAAGQRTVFGAGVAAFGGLAAAATGTRTVLASAAAPLGGLSAAAAGQRTVFGSSAATLGGLTGTAVDAGSVIGTASALLGGLSAAGVGMRTVFGGGSAALGGLTAAAVPPSLGIVGEVHGPLPVVPGEVVVHTGNIAGAVT